METKPFSSAKDLEERRQSSKNASNYHPKTGTRHPFALGYAFARQSLVATMAKSWHLTTETIQLEELARRNVAIRVELLDLVNVRLKAGKAADLDVAEATGDLNVARSGLA